MLKKYAGNPILRSDGVKYPWANLKVYNCAVVFEKNIYHLFFRAIGDKDFISRIGYGKSKDGINFEIDTEPVLVPTEAYEARGCEDPRITKIGQTYYMAYTAFDGRRGRAAITLSTDLKNWTSKKLLFPNWHGSRWNYGSDRLIMMPDLNLTTWNEATETNWSKAAAIFPEKINGKYLLFFGDDNLWSATSIDLETWEVDPKPVLLPRKGYFDQAYVEMGPPPFKTEKGWLVFYHGINRLDNGRTYCIGAALFDLSEPTKVIWRTSKPLIEPTEAYEVLGLIDVMDGGWAKLKTTSQEDLFLLAETNKLPKAVFCSGAAETADKVYQLYYSGADTVLCLASGTLEDILSSNGD